MGGHIDSSTAALTGSDTPVLLEGLCAIDGRLLCTGRLQDLVRATIRCHAALGSSGGGWIVCAEVLDDVVFH